MQHGGLGFAFGVSALTGLTCKGLEFGVLKGSPLLPKIIADKLSDKVQIMMVPSDERIRPCEAVAQPPPRHQMSQIPHPSPPL